MNIFRKFFLVLMTCLFCTMTAGECRECVFVINASESMAKADPNQIIAQSVTWSTENFSAEDEVGIIAFKENVKIIKPLSKVGNNPVHFNVQYSGQSNAGAALLSAIDMLSNKFHTERYIIIFTDGGNLLNKSEQNLRSVENFLAGLEQAKWLGISVYILSLRYDENPPNYHSYGNYAREIPTHYRDLMTTMRTIVHDDFHVPHIELPIKNQTTGDLQCEVPIRADRLKIFLLSSSPGSVELKGMSAGKIVDANFVKIFNAEFSPQSKFELALKYPAGTGLTLDIVPTVKGRVQTDVKSSIFGGKILEITPLHDDGSEKILGDAYFDGKKIGIKIDDKKIDVPISDGVIKVALDDAESVSLQKVYFADVGIIFDGDDTALITVPSTNYAAWIIALAAIGVIGILSCRLSRRRCKPRELVSDSVVVKKNLLPVDKFFAKSADRQSLSFKGKLTIYVTKIPGNENVAPLEYNLFQMNAEKISLAELMTGCGVEEYFADTGRIVLAPTESGLSVVNDSACTILERSDLIAKGQRAELIYGDTINVIMPDETAELILVYKSLKPIEANEHAHGQKNFLGRGRTADAK